MKISVLSVIAVLLLGALPVQSQVVFEETGIKAVFQKAREENKLVFIDCYTSWCGPCKKMLKEVFSRKDIGEYMNTRFVNYKQDMEQEEGNWPGNMEWKYIRLSLFWMQQAKSDTKW